MNQVNEAKTEKFSHRI